MSLDVLLSTSTRAASQALVAVLTRIRPYQWYALDATVACTAVWLLLRWHSTSRQRVRTTPLRGPPSESFLYGVGKRALDPKGSGAIYEIWAKEYGTVYAAPSSLGSSRIILCDPKALAHFYANDTWTYVQTPFARQTSKTFFGKNILSSQGEDHKRQRRILSPAFSMAAIRQLVPIFYDSAYKAKAAWDVVIESNDRDSAVIDVQHWMNYISLDTIGLAGFSHNFGALEGKRTEVTEVFDEFGAGGTVLDIGILLLGLIFPFLARVPTARTKLIHKLNNALAETSKVLLARTRKEMDMGITGGNEEKSIIGLLIKGEREDFECQLTKDEVMAQMKVLLIAGYETTSISMTWALLELARNPEVQTRLRNELLQHGVDPTYEQLTHGLPYLDAVVNETLRVHSPATQLMRMATQDDVVPLSEPIRTKSGELVDSLTIAKGTIIGVSIESMNRSAAIWGEDAKIFCPGRWLEEPAENGGIPAKAKEIQGYHHLLTFSDGPRTCLGKHFALAEFKAVLTVLIKNFVFEMRDGVDTKIEIGQGMLLRPKVVGEEGCKVPLRVRQYVA